MRSRIIIGLLLLSASTINAQKYRIVDTDQTKCFSDKIEIDAPQIGDPFYGQDAQHSGNAASYTDNGDGTITDNITGLVWQKSYQVMSFPQALQAVKNFNLAGHSDWRLPSIKEAYSLILFSGSDVNPALTADSEMPGDPFINTKYFDFKYAANGPRAIDSQMLTSSEYIGSTETEDLIFGVNFADGRIKGYGRKLHNNDKMFVVRFVRGEVYGINNFLDNGDGTIIDNATQLMWSKTDSKRGMNWQEALAYAQEMNAQNYLGHSNWRLPNAKELQSIVDYSRSPLTSNSAAIDPIFDVTTITDEAGEIDFPFFWTSTTHENAEGSAAGAAVYVAFGRSLGNLSNFQQTPQKGSKHNNKNSNIAPTKEPNWVDIHGAGSQRSDPKSGDPSIFANGKGPQGDVIRIYNYVRLVRNK